ncbi:MAG: ABC transporter ATP-binding protein [Gemmatimonadetes bacterium]|nr:ABC transporter ATP-binding protein [Gemmatimonadota bacterium]
MRIELSGVVKDYRSGGHALPILTGIDLSVKSGEAIAVVGPSGSGKTTLLGLMAGLDYPTRGEVRLGDTLLSSLTEDGRARFRATHVGFVFQTFHLIESLSALENVRIPIELSPRMHLPSAEVRKRAAELLERVGLAHRMNHYPGQLSGGERQRVGLARAFVSEPSILFADEPTGNLDRKTGAKVGGLLGELNREHGTTMVLVTHDEALTDGVDRVFRMESGRLEEVA